MKRLALEGTYETHAQFARAGVIALSSAIGSDLTTLSVCDLRTGRRRVLSNPPDALSNADNAAFNRYFHSHPLVRYHAAHQDGGAHRISDSLHAGVSPHAVVWRVLPTHRHRARDRRSAPC